MSYTILSTKKLDPSLQQMLKDEGFLLMEEAFINIRHNVSNTTAEKIKMLEVKDVLVFTSANAVEAVQTYIDVNTAFRIFCIAGKTKDAVERILPNAIIIESDSDADKLAEKIVASGVQQIVFFCGSIRRDELPSMLLQNNILLTELSVYETIETPKQVNTNYDAVLFFSPSAVRSFFTANQLKPAITCFAIGTTTANTIKEFSSNKIIIAEAPSQEALANELQKYFKNQVQR